MLSGYLADFNFWTISEDCFSHYNLFATFYFMDALVRKEKTCRYSAREVTEFGLLMTDIRIYRTASLKYTSLLV